MYDIQVRDNYLNIISPIGEMNITDRKRSEIEIVRKFDSSTTYFVRYRGSIIDGLKDIPFTAFTLDGVPFVNHQEFKDWKNKFTGGSKAIQLLEDIASGQQPPITPTERDVTSFEAITSGVIPTGAVSVSFLFRGNNGTIQGSVRPNNYGKDFAPMANGDTYGEIAYTVPTSGQMRILIEVVR